MRRLVPIISLLIILQGCSAPKMTTVWKASNPLPYRYDRILVVAILPENNDSLEREIETAMVQRLQSSGHNAVSYSDGYSLYQISQLTQEAAYFTLCEKGIDAVLTIAKVNPRAVIPLSRGAKAAFPASFYYNHIWNYRNLTDTILKNDKGLIWESIVFDLRSLQQQAVWQSGKKAKSKDKNERDWIVKNIAAKMEEDKVLQPLIMVPEKKAF